MSRRSTASILSGALLLLAALATPAGATILWSDPGARLVHNTGTGADILGGAVKRNNTNDDALYFKFHVDPLSDVESEPYFAGFQLFEGDEERLGVGQCTGSLGLLGVRHGGDRSVELGSRRIQLQIRASRTIPAGHVLALRIGAPRR